MSPQPLTGHPTRRTFLITVAGSPLLSAATVPELLPSARAKDYETPYKLNKLVVSASPEPKEFDSRTVDCPFVFREDGRFYMAYIGWDGIGYQTGLAESPDLVNWKKVGCILKRDPSNPITRYNVAMNWILRENDMRSPGKLKKVNGQYLGVFHAYPNPGMEEGPAVIGICRSNDLKQWKLGDIVLRPEDGTAWERGGLYKPCLVEHEGIYYLFYNAKTNDKSGWREQTGVATSRDLKTWQRHPGNPILVNGGVGSWDDRFSSDPCVVIDGKTWVMFYYGLDSKGKARDLLALGETPYLFRKVNRILIDVGPAGTVDSTYAHKPSVIFHEGSLYHFYCAVSGKWPNESRGIAVARSTPWA